MHKLRLLQGRLPMFRLEARSPLRAPRLWSHTWHAYGFYADVDFRYHFGAEFAFHQASGSDPILYERTYELGGRYVYPIHDRFLPYAKGNLGRGVFNFEGTTGTGTALPGRQSGV